MNMSDKQGQLFVLSAPSGAGKTTLVHRIMDLRPELRFSISFTTRLPREGEIDGEDYYFLTENQFETMISRNEFLDHAEVFRNQYGTGRKQVAALRELGFDVLLEIDWQGAAQVRANQPDCCSVFILPPSLPELERRLRGRGTDSEAVIKRRFGEAVEDMSHWIEFDHVLINDDLEAATETLLEIMDGESGGTTTSDPLLQSKIESLLAG